MQNYVKKLNLEKYTELLLDVADAKLMAIGEKMEEIDENAYMNGYNWEAFLNCYLRKNASDLLDGMYTDPEADMYVAYYDLTPENEQKVDRFIEIVTDLVENEDKIYNFMQEYCSEIEWD